jgi:hypothetical protein
MRKVLLMVLVVLAMATVAGVASATNNGGIQPFGSGYRP